MHWQPVKPAVVEKTIWNKLDDEKIKFNTSEFEQLFCSALPSSGKKKVNKPKPVEESKEIKLLDSKRSNNVSIALSRLRLPHENVRTALFNMDTNVLDEETLTMLANCAPQADEMKKLKEYTGPLSQLATPERFMKVVMEVPAVGARIGHLTFKAQYPHLCEEIGDNLTLLTSAEKRVRTQEGFQYVLEVVLALGNYLNGGTSKGGAFGFRLNTLNKLKATKSAKDPETGLASTLLDYVVRTVNKQRPTARSFLSDFSILADAARAELSLVTGDIMRFAGAVRKLEGALKTLVASPRDRFQSVMGDFCAKARAQADQFETRLKDLTSKCKELVLMFGEDPKTGVEEIYSTIYIFAMDFKHSEDATKQALEDKEKRNKQEAAAAHRRQMMAAVKQKGLKKPPKQGGRGSMLVGGGGGLGMKKSTSNMDDMLSNLRSGDATSIAASLRKRRQDRKAKALGSRLR